MSPASAVDPAEQEQQLQSLARAFEGLLLTVHDLSCKEQNLQQRLKYAHDEYVKLANRFTSGSAETSVVADKILGYQTELDDFPDHPLDLEDVVNSLKDADPVREQILGAISDGLDSYRSIAAAHGSKLLRNKSSPCLVRAEAEESVVLERDYTRNGSTQGSLCCPFSNTHNGSLGVNGQPGMAQNSHCPRGDTCGHEDIDPIKAEMSDHPEHPAASSTGRVCPIRFLDQHKPEEIAEYVERHKHEIPRSHAICVKRYQKDAQSMRQLDAKYGNLINMIRGLGAKHQAFLPHHEQNGGPSTSSISTERLQNWADNVSAELRDDDEPNTTTEPHAVEAGPEEREGHFDRPLREVRVGESPSRPWGISVPVPYEMQPVTSETHSVASIPDIGGQGHEQGHAKPLMSDRKPPEPVADVQPTNSSALRGRCPFGHGAPQQDAAAKTANMPPGKEGPPATNDGVRTLKRNPGSLPDATTEKTAVTPKVIFNGPVFFGYSPEQAAALLQELGSTIPKQESR